MITLGTIVYILAAIIGTFNFLYVLFVRYKIRQNKNGVSINSMYEKDTFKIYNSNNYLYASALIFIVFAYMGANVFELNDSASIIVIVTAIFVSFIVINVSKNLSKY